MVCCAIVKEKISFGPTTNNLGVSPLKNPPAPSFLTSFRSIEMPDSGESKGLFWILVLITSNGCATVMEAIAPADDDIASCAQVAACPSSPTPISDLAAAFPPKRANDPGAFLAAVQPAPRYRLNPSFAKISNTPRPRSCSGAVCAFTFSASSGNRNTSPTPIMLPDTAAIIVLPCCRPNRSSNCAPYDAASRSRRTGWPPNL
mmetsp:Transcript_32110/g.49655  ORF Transcript_32110/g.49655 Transcript_32110/m.49655 type:complete len:203 (+) Transcript_32110:70-678(+)